jgi:phage gpG-like protein
MIAIEFNDDAVERVLSDIATQLADLTPLMGDIGEALVLSTQDRIGRGVSPDGTAFAPRKASTLKAYARRRQTPRGGPLELTGTLRDTIAYAAGPDFVEVGSSRIYAATMQFGAEAGAFGAHVGKDKRGRDHFHPIPWGDIPARAFLGVSEADRDAILETAAEWLAQLAAGGS